MRCAWSVYGNGNEFDGPHPIALGYKQINDYEVILKMVGERVKKSIIGAPRAYVRTRSTYPPVFIITCVHAMDAGGAAIVVNGS